MAVEAAARRDTGSREICTRVVRVTSIPGIWPAVKAFAAEDLRSDCSALGVLLAEALKARGYSLDDPVKESAA
jgi:hypothetical protein